MIRHYRNPICKSDSPERDADASNSIVMSPTLMSFLDQNRRGASTWDVVSSL